MLGRILRSPSTYCCLVLMRFYRYGRSCDSSLFRMEILALPVAILQSALVHRFKQSGGALATADTHGNYTIAGLAPLHFVDESSGKAGTGHAEGMPDGDRASIDIQFAGIKVETVAAIHHLHREGFVQFP